MKNKVILLIGPPLSGKDTYLNQGDFGDYKIISRDDILMTLYGGDDYTEAFKVVNQKLVDKILNKEILDASLNEQNVVINMTNLSVKSRHRHLCKFDSNDYEKIAVIFPKLSMNEYESRNSKRKQEINKFIPLEVIRDMVGRWEEVTLQEGFDKIIKL